MVLVMGLIFYLSHQPGNRLELPPIDHIDKLAHLLAYGVLAGTVIFAFIPKDRAQAPKMVFITTIIICCLYGIVDEFHQTFVSLRSASIYDVMADTLGAIIVGGIWFRHCSLKKNRISF